MVIIVQLIHDQEVKDLTKRMEAESKEQMRQLAKKHKDKQAINRYMSASIIFNIQ